jgi:hypothetical protein
MRSPYWRESSASCISFARRVDLLGASSSAATPLTSSSTAPREKFDSFSNKYNYTKWNDYSKGGNKKKYSFENKKKKKKKFQKIMS